MKQILKHLAQDIHEVLEQTSVANEMGALIDYGEWSQSSPDFTQLIGKWKLTRDKLLSYCAQAAEYSVTFRHKFPVHPRDWKSKKGYWNHVTREDINPWLQIALSFDMIFMAGFLNNDLNEDEPIIYHQLGHNN
jgi:hypothetical protein